MTGNHLAPLSASAIDILTANEATDVERAFGFLQNCARLVGIPHAEWWQLDYHTGMAFPWRVIDVAAPHGPTGTSHTVITLRFGDWRFPDNPSPTTVAKTRHRSIHDLRIELEARGYTLRGVWELRERGYTTDLMATSRLTRPQTSRTKPGDAPQ